MEADSSADRPARRRNPQSDWNTAVNLGFLLPSSLNEHTQDVQPSQTVPSRLPATSIYDGAPGTDDINPEEGY